MQCDHDFFGRQSKCIVSHNCQHLKRPPKFRVEKCRHWRIICSRALQRATPPNFAMKKVHGNRQSQKNSGEERGGELFCDASFRDWKRPLACNSCFRSATTFPVLDPLYRSEAHFAKIMRRRTHSKIFTVNATFQNLCEMGLLTLPRPLVACNNRFKSN